MFDLRDLWAVLINRKNEAYIAMVGADNRKTYNYYKGLHRGLEQATDMLDAYILVAESEGKEV